MLDNYLLDDVRDRVLVGLSFGTQGMSRIKRWVLVSDAVTS